MRSLSIFSLSSLYLHSPCSQPSSRPRPSPPFMFSPYLFNLAARYSLAPFTTPLRALLFPLPSVSSPAWLFLSRWRNAALQHSCKCQQSGWSFLSASFACTVSTGDHFTSIRLCSSCHSSASIPTVITTMPLLLLPHFSLFYLAPNYCTSTQRSVWLSLCLQLIFEKLDFTNVFQRRRQ